MQRNSALVALKIPVISPIWDKFYMLICQFSIYYSIVPIKQILICTQLRFQFPARGRADESPPCCLPESDGGELLFPLTKRPVGISALCRGLSSSSLSGAERDQFYLCVDMNTQLSASRGHVGVYTVCSLTPEASTHMFTALPQSLFLHFQHLDIFHSFFDYIDVQKISVYCILSNTSAYCERVGLSSVCHVSVSSETVFQGCLPRIWRPCCEEKGRGFIFSGNSGNRSQARIFRISFLSLWSFKKRVRMEASCVFAILKNP